MAFDKKLADMLWTARWGLKNKKPDLAYDEVTKALVHIGAEPSAVVIPPKIPTNPVPTPPVKGEGKLWIPFAKVYKSMKAQGTFKYKYPVMILLHHSAGRYEKGLQSALDMIDWGIGQGYNYLAIGTDGSLVQSSPLDKWGHHAGESSWSKFLPKWVSGSVSDESVGIEVTNAGKVEKTSDGRYKTWFGTYLKPEEVRYVTEAEWGCPTGWYHKFTPAQEAKIIETIVWIIKNDPNGILTADHVVGHHEVAGKLGLGYFRKNDPGGSMSMPMDKLRVLINEKLKD